MYYIRDKGTNKRGQYKIKMFLFLLSSERTLDRRSKLCKSNEKPNLLFYFLNPCIIAVPYQGTLNLRCSLPSRQSLKGTKKVDNNAKKVVFFFRKPPSSVNRTLQFYNLDAVISVGYRVKCTERRYAGVSKKVFSQESSMLLGYLV